MGIPMSNAYLAIPVGASIMAVQLLLLAFSPEIMRQWSPAAVEDADPAG